jgi:hypothetical protein
VAITARSSRGCCNGQRLQGDKQALWTAGRGRLAYRREWIDGGTLTERINFAVNQVRPFQAGRAGVVQRLAQEVPALAGAPVDRLTDLAASGCERGRAQPCVHPEMSSGVSFATEADRAEAAIPGGATAHADRCAPGTPVGLSASRE